MAKIISIKTDNPALFGILNSDLPKGVKITSDSPYVGPVLEVTLATDIQIEVDLATIEKNDFIAWLINRVITLKGNHNININRQQISVDNPDAVELLTKEIEGEE